MKEKNTLKVEITIGTCGYSYEDWRGHFYPEKIPKGDMLGFYAQYFKTVEINSSYYHIPSAETIKRIAKKTPPDFGFIVKTNQETTHRRKENEAALKQLTEALQPMLDSGKLKGLLAQFPYSFKNNEENRNYLFQTRKLSGALPLFVEFRNYTWENEYIPDFLKNNGIGYVNVDEPELKGLLPKQDIVTTDTGYIRLHGRNEKDWWDGTGSDRYNYEYDEEQLKEWLTNISNILKKTYKTYIFFNNHPNGQAVRNARQMVQILNDQMDLFGSG
jgi:uncharacterized protein YecE (DUF72 family)